MNLFFKAVLLVSFALLMLGCELGEDSSKTAQQNSQVIDTKLKKTITGRWYTAEQQQQGLIVFAENCAICHGNKAQETVDWKTRTESGHYPPPPLNGTAHAWHHALSVLEAVIREGGKPSGGVMPAWEGILSDDEVRAVIAAFQSYWSDEVYERWLEIDQNSR